MRTVGGTVPFPVPAEVAFDYLVDPANRPQWQSSLAAVEDVAGEVGVGQTWTDVTKPGLRPAMRTTSYDRPRQWSEDGTWKAVTAALDLVISFPTFGAEFAGTLGVPALCFSSRAWAELCSHNSTGNSA